MHLVLTFTRFANALDAVVAAHVAAAAQAAEARAAVAAVAGVVAVLGTARTAIKMDTPKIVVASKQRPLFAAQGLRRPKLKGTNLLVQKGSE